MARTGEQSPWRPRIERVLAHFASPADRTGALVSDFERLLVLVDTWNRKMDLTAARNEDELCDLMFADALLIARHATDAETRWVDVGSGAGAPAIPLALLLPRSRFTLVEPREKRVAFLRTLIGTLGRPEIEVVRDRSSALPDHGFDVALSRATLPPDQWLREGTRLATQSVWVLLAAGDPPKISGWHADRDERYVWPLTGAQRRAVRFVPETPC